MSTAGNGYGIMSPDMYQLNGCVTVQDHHLVIGGTDPDNGGAIYIPLLPSAPTKAEMRSISCQTTEHKTAAIFKMDDLKKSPSGAKEEKVSKKAEKLEKKAEKKQEKQERKLQEKSEKQSDKRSEKSEGEDRKFERTQSLREKKDKDRKEKEVLARSLSLRYNDDKARAVIKDINLKTCNIHQDKDKGGILCNFLYLLCSGHLLCPISQLSCSVIRSYNGVGLSSGGGGYSIM